MRHLSAWYSSYSSFLCVWMWVLCSFHAWDNCKAKEHMGWDGDRDVMWIACTSQMLKQLLWWVCCHCIVTSYSTDISIPSIYILSVNKTMLEYYVSYPSSLTQISCHLSPRPLLPLSIPSLIRAESIFSSNLISTLKKF